MKNLLDVLHWKICEFQKMKKIRQCFLQYLKKTHRNTEKYFPENIFWKIIYVETYIPLKATLM